jgi:large subunit ribosomal protein L9
MIRVEIKIGCGVGPRSSGARDKNATEIAGGKNMKVILDRDIQNLGEEGDIKDVKSGYARNYLLPNKFVMPYSKKNLLALEQRKASIEKRKETKRQDASSLKERLEADEIVFHMPAGTAGRLFGSVSNALIAEALDKKGYNIERKRIEVPDHTIKQLGDYKVKIKLYERKEAILKVKVEKIEE